MQLSYFSRPPGFTLIELLTILAVIGILSAILIPAVGKVREAANRAVDASNLRQIGQAAMLYAAENHGRLPATELPALDGTGGAVPATPWLWAAALARYNLLPEAGLYFSRSDPHGPADPATSVLNAARTALDPVFAESTLSFELVGGLRSTDPSHTPLAFTRGLRADGTWDSEKGVYGDQGGHILFLGNHVVFYRSTAGQLTLRDGRRGTHILQTLPAAARVYAGKGDHALIGSETGRPAEPPE